MSSHARWASLLVVGLLASGPGCQSAPPVEEAAPAEEVAEGEPKPAETPAKPADPKAPAGGDTRESLSPGGAMLPEEALDRFGKAGGVKATEDRQMAQHHYEVGERLFGDMDYERAWEELRRAMELDPTHQAASELYYRAGSIIGKREDELRGQLQQLRDEHNVKIQLVQQEMLRSFEAGEKAFKAGDHDEAIRSLERAREIIAWYPYPVDTGAPTSYATRADALIKESKKKRLQAELEKRDRQERDAIDIAKQQEDDKLRADRNRIDMMLKQTSDLLHARRFRQALTLSDRVLALDPHNPFARKYREYATLGIHTETDRGIDERHEEERKYDEIHEEQATTPQEGRIIVFPANYQERVEGRKPGIAPDITEEPFWVRNYRKILRERRVTLNFPDVPLQDVILFLQDITGLNFVIGQGVDATERRISLRLKDIVLENALKIILEQTKLTFTFEKESIIIKEPGEAAGETYFEIYDVADILFKIKDFPAGKLSLPNPDAPTGSGGGASLIFDDAADGEESTINADVLIEIIKGSSGGDEAWGDGTGIEGHRGQLLVTNVREIHAKIVEVLENLRRNQGIFVHIETRFIDITNDMLEDVGVDFRGLGGNPGDERIDPTTGAPRPNYSGTFGEPRDMFVDGNRFGGTDVGGSRVEPGGSRVDAQGNPINVPGPNPEPGNDNFVWRTQNIFGSNIGGMLLQGARLASQGGGILQVTQLDHWQTNMIIRAEAQESRVRRLTAPRVTAANRERVFTQVITQRAYIADWELISGGTGLVVIEVADPIIQTFQEGVILEVKPTVSADRKFITLDVRPSMATLVGGQITTVIVNLGSGARAAISVPIGIPEITLEEAFTSVTIPDGGTALLGGFRQVTDRDNESSLPIVDSVPVLNFFFRRKGQLRETRSLIILVTAKIVSIRDEEAKLFNQPESE